MEIKDRKVMTELKVIRDRLREIETENIAFNSHIKIVQCEASLDVLINLLEEPLVIG